MQRSPAQLRAPRRASRVPGLVSRAALLRASQVASPARQPRVQPLSAAQLPQVRLLAERLVPALREPALLRAPARLLERRVRQVLVRLLVQAA